MTLKQKTYSYLLQIINEKIQTLQHELNELLISISNETKSSAGDKYETSRAMLQIEQDQLNKQLSNALQQKTLLDSIDIDLTHECITIGDLIKTNHAYFFLSIGLGKIEIDGIPVIILSALSPLGKKLFDLKQEHTFLFNGKHYIIEVIY